MKSRTWITCSPSFICIQ